MRLCSVSPASHSIASLAVYDRPVPAGPYDRQLENASHPGKPACCGSTRLLHTLLHDRAASSILAITCMQYLRRWTPATCNGFCRHKKIEKDCHHRCIGQSLLSRDIKLVAMMQQSCCRNWSRLTYGTGKVLSSKCSAAAKRMQHYLTEGCILCCRKSSFLL